MKTKALLSKFGNNEKLISMSFDLSEIDFNPDYKNLYNLFKKHLTKEIDKIDGLTILYYAYDLKIKFSSYRKELKTNKHLFGLFSTNNTEIILNDTETFDVALVGVNIFDYINIKNVTNADDPFYG